MTEVTQDLKNFEKDRNSRAERDRLSPQTDLLPITIPEKKPVKLLFFFFNSKIKKYIYPS